ncbi:MAG TPA: hypothetical protein VHW24_11050 [Bryobacteraceae bacterium]|nr:hypothetical protein [Bryobacteraceae bacterium]
MRRNVFVLPLAVSVLGLSGWASEETTKLTPAAIVASYCSATQQAPVKAASMDMDIQASLPGLKKQGRFHALRKINPIGGISYVMATFEGDTAVRNQVVKRYLEAEVEAQQDDNSTMAVTPENYKFQYKGEKADGGRTVHVFELTPKHKRKGLFKGEIWIDAASFLPVREAGALIKRPSIFVKKVAFVRTFDIRDGMPVPVQVQSTVKTVFGAAELTVDYTNFALGDGDGSADIDNR